MKAAKKKPWIHHGDIIEGITRRDRRFSICEHKESVLGSISMATESMKKAKDTCIGLLKGNHDECPGRDIGDVSEYIAGSARVPYLTDSCFIDFTSRSGSITGFFAHGAGGNNPRAGDPERKQINRQIWLRNLLSQFNADIAGIGHTHRFTVTPRCSEEKLTIGDKDNVRREPVVTRPCWYYTAPSMFKTYDLHADTGNYAEMKLYGATDIGWVELVFNSDASIGCIREVYHTGKVKQEWTERIVG